MTPIADHATTAPEFTRFDASRITRSIVAAAFSALLLVQAAWLSGLVPEDAHVGLLWGAGLAVVSSAIGISILARCCTVPNVDPQRTAQLYLVGLSANLGLQAITVVIGLVVFSSGGEKFPALAAFGLTFAAVAGLMQVIGSISISRFLRERAAAAAAHRTEGSS